MARRSRKRGRRAKPVAAEVATGPRPTASAGPVTRTGPAAKSRSELRNEAVRATLVPFAPGERPWPIKVATVIAVLVGGGDLVDVLLGGRFSAGGSHPNTAGVVLFSVLILVCAWGMWRMRYWAVLAFQAVLGIVILLFSVLLIRASSVLGLVVALAIIGGGGLLFYKLVRVLSRLQTPARPGS